MITQVHTIWVATTDMAGSTAFYRDVLGLQPVIESPYWTSFNLGGVTVALHAGDEATTAGGWVLGLATDDLAALCARLVQAGVALDEPHDIPGGVVVGFRDPNGARIQATQLGLTAADLRT